MINNREEGIMYPQVDPSEWSKLHRVKIKNNKCRHCGKRRTANIPVALNGWRGFQAEICCTAGHRLMVVVPSCPKRRRDVVNFFYTVRSAMRVF